MWAFCLSPTLLQEFEGIIHCSGEGPFTLEILENVISTNLLLFHGWLVIQDKIALLLKKTINHGGDTCIK